MALKFLNNGYFAGKVGIGTETPDRKLHVKDSTIVVSEFEGTNTGSLMDLVNSNSSQLYNGIRFTQGTTSKMAITHIADGTTKGYIQIGNSWATGSEILVVDGRTSNVGIGATAPLRKLHVAGGNGFAVNASTTQYYGVYIPALGEGADPQIQIGDWHNAGSTIKWDSSARSLNLDTQYSTSAGTFNITGNDGASTFLTILPSGNVGIGTTSPAKKLEISSGTNGDGILLTGNGSFANGDSRNIEFSYSDTDTSYASAIKFEVKDATVHGGQIGFFTDAGPSSSGSLGASIRAMTIDPSQNVGIGTSTPTAPLHIEGGTNSEVLKIEADANPYIRWVENGTNVGFLQFLGDNAYLSNMANGSLFFRTNNTDKMTILPGGNVGIGTTSPTAKLHVAGTGLFTGLVSGITPVAAANFVTKAYVDGSGGGTGPFLPLAGGTMTGNITLPGEENNTFKIGFTGASATSGLSTVDQNGAGLYIGANSKLNNSGNVVYNNSALPSSGIYFDGWDGDDMEFYTGASGNPTKRLTISSTGNATFTGDVSALRFDMNPGYAASAEYMSISKAQNQDGGILLKSKPTGGSGRLDWQILNHSTTGDLRFYGYGLAGFALTLDREDGNATFAGNITADGTIQILDSAANLTISGDTNGNAYYNNSVGTHRFRAGGSSVNSMEISSTYITLNEPVTATSTVTATTFLGDLNGTINTATTAVTQVDAVDNDTVATTAYVNNKIALIPAGLVFQGTWNAATNTPTLTSGSGTTGNFYIVSVAGSTNLDGITDWKVGDWAVFIEQGASDQWEKIDNSSVLDGIGTGQTLPLWSGSGTSNTLTDSLVSQPNTTTVQLNNADLKIVNDLQTGGNGKARIKFCEDATANSMDIYYDGDGQTGNANYTSIYSYSSGIGDVLTATYGGNVGIGTNSPYAFDTTATKLHVKNTGSSGSLSEIARFEGSSDADGSGGTIRLGTSNDRGIYFEGGRTGSVPYGKIGTTEYDGTKTLAITLDNTGNATFAGNVGIGVTPRTISNYKVLDISGSGGSGGYIGLSSGSTQQGELYSHGGGVDLVAIGAKQMRFFTNGSQQAVITSDGKVGIGATSPLAELQVGLSTSNTGNRSTLAMFGAEESGILNALSLVNTNGAAATGYGTRINFHLSYNYSPTGCIEVVTEDLTSNATDSTMRFSTYGTISGSTTYQSRLEISSAGAIKFNDYNSTKQTGTPTYLLGTDGSGNVVKTLTTPSPITSQAASLYDLIPNGAFTTTYAFTSTAGTYAEVMSGDDVITATGTYSVQMVVNDFAVGGTQYDEKYSGVMTWHKTSTNDAGVGSTSEIVLHRSGHAGNQGITYLRTRETTSADNNELKLEIMCNKTYTGASNVIFKFVRLI
jgi:hypothetical protein